MVNVYMEPLTAREEEVLALLVKGMSNQEIADELLLSVKTVQNHVLNIRDKFGAANRTEAAILAVLTGRVSLSIDDFTHD